MTWLLSLRGGTFDRYRGETTEDPPPVVIAWAAANDTRMTSDPARLADSERGERAVAMSARKSPILLRRGPCGSCRELWPCKVVRLDREASAIIWAAKHACHRCGKSAGWHVKVPGGGDLGEDAIYHARKGPCRTMARKAFAYERALSAVAAVEDAVGVDAAWPLIQRLRGLYFEARETGLLSAEDICAVETRVFA